MTFHDQIPLAYRLAPEMLAAVEDGAGRLPEAVRAAFFKDVCDILRPVRELAQTDVRRAVYIALHKHKGIEETDDDAV